MDSQTTLIVQLAGMFLSTGTGVYVGLKVAINGLKEATKEIKQDVKRVAEDTRWVRQEIERGRAIRADGGGA